MRCGKRWIPMKKETDFFNDLSLFNSFPGVQGTYTSNIKSLDELLERDRLREKDGFPRKIRVGRLIKPSRRGRDKVIVVPTTVEEKLIHNRVSESEEETSSSGGSGDGDVGEVIGEQPVRPEAGSGQGPGEGEEGRHEIESSAYDLGRILTEKFELPNLKDKGIKRSMTRYTYDMTDKNAGFGQFLDKKATLRKIVETNISLGNIPDVSDIDTTGFMISPRDKIYRILSKEKDYDSQAVVFFVRDYSGSMEGKATETVVSQHVLIYSWLLYQYQKQVETRFIVHDTQAKEVEDFHEYYNAKVAGGTKVAVAYRLVSEIVEKENLINDYNIYIFHGTDGDDWDTTGSETLPEVKKILSYASRFGITIAERQSGAGRETEVERYIRKSNFLEEKPELIRMDVLSDDADESRLIESIKRLIS
ncbi:MAG: DUF444 family protein [Desulfobacteraceae bacterium]|nr:DUF444 family protein [Desulfobacteraceae bacterium]